HPVPLADLPRRYPADPGVPVRGCGDRRRRPGAPVLQPHAAAAEVHDHHLLHADGRRFAGVLRPDLRAHRRWSGGRDPGPGPGHVPARLPRAHDGAGERGRRDPRPARPGAGPGAAAPRWAGPERQPAGGSLIMAIPQRTVAPPAQPEPSRTYTRRRPNIPAGVLSTVWLLVVMVPIYWVVTTSFKSSAGYYQSNAMAPPTDPTLENFQLVIASDFVQYFGNSVVITVGAVVPAVLMSFMCAFAIVRGGTGRYLRGVNALFLMGLAIPLQATIIPVYL